MKNKIIGIFVCMLIMSATLVPVAGAVNNQTSRFVKETSLCTPANPLGIIYIKIVGKVTSVIDPDHLLGDVVKVNDTMTGKYVYDSGTADSKPDDPSIGIYTHTSSSFGIKINIGNLAFNTNPNTVKFEIQIGDNYGGSDFYTVTSFNNLQLSNGMSVDLIQWVLMDSYGTAVSSDVLPTTAPVLDGWNTNILQLSGKDPADPNTHFQIFVKVTTATTPKTVDTYEAKSSCSTSEVIMPYQYTTPFLQFWEKFFERFPHEFPFLQSLLQL